MSLLERSALFPTHPARDLGLGLVGLAGLLAGGAALWGWSAGLAWGGLAAFVGLSVWVDAREVRAEDRYRAYLTGQALDALDAFIQDPKTDVGSRWAAQAVGAARRRAQANELPQLQV